MPRLTIPYKIMLWILLALATTIGVANCSRDGFGVPYANDSTVQAHLEARAKLIATEKTQRQGNQCSITDILFEFQ